MLRTAQRSQSRTEVVNAFMRGVYQWMAAGLGVTAIAAFAVASSPALVQLIFGTPMLPLILMIGLVGLVFYLSARIGTMSAGTATTLFMVYSALNGVVLSSVLLVYAASSVFQAFATAAAMFGAMTIYGLTTKRDLTSMGSFMFMGIIGIIIASIVNIFIGSSMMELVISAVGVIVFTGLTAYDSQQLREMGETAPMDDAVAIRRGTILGALRLYLDFINLFLMLLRLFGGARD
ncbi:Bax inhibitor-1 family protein [Oleidesulfovibrio sp.]|uniref:Bax inhibitor-1/YccA family protein n=1 Tax=Oleidesulfovibrio sp. TaxID=2909707 RepID=UPI003A897136